MLSRRDFLRIGSVAGASLLTGCRSEQAVPGNDPPSGRRPNVILVMTDDQGYGDLSCHGNPVLKTPNLDHLYAESVRFTDFHVNPFCAPTRASLMVGRLSDRVGVRRTLNMRNYLPAGEKTMADVFRANGYRTGLFGKWHLGHNYPYRPIDRGFEEWFGIGDCGLAATSDYWGNDRFDDYYNHNGRWEKAEGFNTDVFFDRAIQFIHSSRTGLFSCTWRRTCRTFHGTFDPSGLSHFATASCPRSWTTFTPPLHGSIGILAGCGSFSTQKAWLITQF